jgi:hypothetical protein
MAAAGRQPTDAVATDDASNAMTSMSRPSTVAVTEHDVGKVRSKANTAMTTTTSTTDALTS